MTYWTILILTYQIQSHGFVEARVIFPSQYECIDAMDAMYDPVVKNYPTSMAHCEQSEVISSMNVKPRPRP